MKTIGIIDDDIHIGNMLEEALRKAGYGVLRAYSGRCRRLYYEALSYSGITGQDHGTT